MQEYRSELDHPRLNQKRSHGDNKMLDTDLPRPSPFDELSWIFYLRRQEASRLGDSTEDHSLNPNYLEDTVKKGRELFLGVSPMRTKTEEEEEYRLDHPLSNKKKSHGDNKKLNTVLCKICRTPMGEKMEAEERQEVEDENLPRPSPFDELSSIFYGVSPMGKKKRTDADESLLFNNYTCRPLFV